MTDSTTQPQQEQTPPENTSGGVLLTSTNVLTVISLAAGLISQAAHRASGQEQSSWKYDSTMVGHYLGGHVGDTFFAVKIQAWSPGSGDAEFNGTSWVEVQFAAWLD